MRRTVSSKADLASLILFLAASQLIAFAQSVAVQEADAHFQAQRWAEAARAYEAITKAEPLNGRAWYRLGMSLHSSGNYAQAVPALERAAEILKGPVVMYNLACAYARVDDKEKAFQMLASALKAGFPQPSRMKSDPDLATLAGEARFKELLEMGERLAKPCMFAPEYRQFDFWVGEWTVETPQGQKAGTNSVQRIEDGCIIYENWVGAGGGSGKSFNFYDAVKGKWRQVWISNTGSVLELAGEFKDGAMRYTGETLTRNGGKVLERLTFFNLGPGRVRQFWEQSADGGKTWAVAFDGMYIRKK